MYFELGEDISLHFDCAVYGRRARSDADIVTAKVQFGRKHEVCGGNPELRGFAGFLEYLVAFWIFDFKRDCFAAEGLLGSPVESQTAQMNCLSRLVKWFVG